MNLTLKEIIEKITYSLTIIVINTPHSEYDLDFFKKKHNHVKIFSMDEVELIGNGETFLNILIIRFFIYKINRLWGSFLEN